MACHRNNHQLHSHHQPCCCCCCAPSCCQSSPHPVIPSTTATTANDPLLRAIAAHLLQSPPAAPQPAYHLCNQQYSKPQYPHPQQQQHQQQQPQQKYQHQQQPQAQSLIQSLLRRIAALESALPHLSSTPLPPAAAPELRPRKPHPPPPMPPTNPRVSIRDLAARTIQAHFRLYLVRRSQALRHLKHLASVRSQVAAIKSSLSDEARLSPKALSQKAADLLLQLESIQSTDPMIREGKRSIGRELLRLLEFAERVSAKRHELFLESLAIAHKGNDPAAFAEKSSPGVEELAAVFTAFGEDVEESDAGSPEMRAPTSKTAKRVSFAEDWKASRVSTAAGAPFAEEEAMRCGAVGRASDEHRRPSMKEPSSRVNQGLGGFSRVSVHGVDAQWEGSGGGGGDDDDDDGSRHTTDDEKSPGGRQTAGIIRPVVNGLPSGQKGAHLLGLSAPLPLQMEPRRAESKKKKKNVVVV